MNRGRANRRLRSILLSRCFETIADGDVLLVHPYERFDPVVRMIEEAASDDDVLAIKQVLYRTQPQ